MRFFVTKEVNPEETRIALIPDAVRRLVDKGVEIVVQSQIGEKLQIADAEYEKAGAIVATDVNAALREADVVLRLGKPPIEQVELLKKGALHISYLDPFNEKNLVHSLSAQEVTAVSMEMIPRTTVAQKMDALSSQANLAGYVAIILAAERLDKILPMMMTPAGTIPPARVFVIGVGVAGLQAIATAKRLGARVEAFDTRPVVEEQVHSLGAKFVKVDLGETGQTTQGYAKALTEEQMEKQRQAMAKHCASADIVITTAQLFGRPAPRIVTDAMIAGMQPGSVVIDLAVETGGNVEGSEVGREVVKHGVKIVGVGNFPGRVALNASQMYSSNLANLIEHFWDSEQKTLRFDLEDEIWKGCVVTHAGKVVNPMLEKIYSPQSETAAS